MPNWFLKMVRPVYHGTLAVLAGFYYGRPSGKMTVIGITGTAGKSTTAALLSCILNSAGRKCGYMTTVNFFDGKKDYINKRGLSMPGGPEIQKRLRQMLDNGCQFAIVECTSEGLAQNRHLGIKFDAALLTNLSPAHIEAHGSFENYRAAKAKLFKGLRPKAGRGIIGANLDDASAGYFLGFGSGRKFGISFGGAKAVAAEKIYQAVKNETGFVLENQNFEIKLPGDFNKYNALMAAACANMFGADLKTAAAAVSAFEGIRGRMEPVENNRGIKIYVDYGCEPASFKAALRAASDIPHRKLIHVFGSTGGHRDKSKRFEFGKISAGLTDYIIITNDDVYDSSPEKIANDIETGIRAANSKQQTVLSYEKILDRKQAIARALTIAQKDDLVLITGKGSEQFLVLPGNKRIDWDDVAVVKTQLEKLS